MTQRRSLQRDWYGIAFVVFTYLHYNYIRACGNIYVTAWWYLR